MILFSDKKRMMSSRKHKSAQDFKNKKVESVHKKLGGKEQADEILAEWKVHRLSEKTNDR